MTEQPSQQLRQTVPAREQMQSAVARRDASWDGVFYYGVITTGVFCKPSCASRPARPENQRYFADIDAALANGFRACKRCRPDKLDNALATVARVARYIDSHADESLTLAKLSREAELSPSRFQKAFKAAMGVSPKQYQDAARLKKLKASLKGGDEVTGAIFSAGFGSTSRVYGESARNMGMTPLAYRSGGTGERIFHAYRDSALGPLLMAATDRGVCFAQFGDSRRQLEVALQAEFPNAELVRSPQQDGADLDRWINALDRHLGAQAPRPDLPLDLRGTAFQLKVWRFLLSVKEGDVLSYGELAKGIGRPTAFRAVASACGANRVGVLIPCHRVLRGDGDIGGYRWGVDRKRTLLDKERKQQAKPQ